MAHCNMADRGLAIETRAQLSLHWPFASRMHFEHALPSNGCLSYAHCDWLSSPKSRSPYFSLVEGAPIVNPAVSILVVVYASVILTCLEHVRDEGHQGAISTAKRSFLQCRSSGRKSYGCCHYLEVYRFQAVHAHYTFPAHCEDSES